MSYIVKQFKLKSKIKAFKFLIDQQGYTMKDAQRLIDRKRLLVNGKVLVKKSAYIKGNIEIIEFQPNTQNNKPFFQTADFALFDKPSGILVHPNNRNTQYSLTHEIKYLFGNKANITHRIDKETSGIVIAAKHPLCERKIKMAFEERKIKKGYLALVKGKIDQTLSINEPILKNRDFSTIKLKVYIDKEGKESHTLINPIKYYRNTDTTLVEAIPLTGRQHQIRLHLFHVKHPIIGDPLYGIETSIAEKYLDGTLNEKDRIKYTGAKRLMLHASWIQFNYHNQYKLYSRYDFEEEINLYQKTQLL